MAPFLFKIKLIYKNNIYKISMNIEEPRIYVYKITFEGDDHYYYGYHKEKKFDEYYMGSPVTHKDHWNKFTPRKEYIKFFEYSEEGRLEALKFEKYLIKPVYKNEPLCLNEGCGGSISPEACSRGGKIVYERKIGVFARSKEQMTEDGKKAGKLTYERKVGVHGLTKEHRRENSKKGGKISGNQHKKNKTGVCGRSKEQMTVDGEKGGNLAHERGLGVHNRSKEQMTENGKKGGQSAYENKKGFHSWTEEQKVEHNKKIGRRAYELGRGIHSQTHEEKVQCGMRTYELGVGVHALTSEERSEMGKLGGIKTSSQVWKCTITGYETNAGALTIYQRNRGIVTSNRIRIK